MKPYDMSIPIHISYVKLAEIIGCMWGGMFVHTVKNLEGETGNEIDGSESYLNIHCANSNRHIVVGVIHNTPVIPHIRFLMTIANRYLSMERSWG